MFARKNADGNYELFADDGLRLTVQPDSWPTIWPVGSEVSARREHPEGLTLPPGQWELIRGVCPLEEESPITRIKVYWDTQDTNNEGWAYRLFAGEREVEPGAVDEDWGPDPWVHVVELAWDNGIDITRSDVMEHQEDGGWAEWVADSEIDD